MLWRQIKQRPFAVDFRCEIGFICKTLARKKLHKWIFFIRKVCRVPSGSARALFCRSILFVPFLPVHILSRTSRNLIFLLFSPGLCFHPGSLNRQLERQTNKHISKSLRPLSLCNTALKQKQWWRSHESHQGLLPLSCLLFVYPLWPVEMNRLSPRLKVSQLRVLEIKIHTL